MNKFIVSSVQEDSEEITFHGIPFRVTQRDGLVQPLPYTVGHPNDWPVKGVPINAPCQALFFLGMVTEKPEGSEWWGLSERYHYHGKRLFMGCALGHSRWTPTPSG